MRINCPECKTDSTKQSCLGKWTGGGEYRCDFCGHEYESNESSQDGPYVENVLADIRNKLGPACTLVQLLEEYMIPLPNRMRTLEEMDYLRDSILKLLPKAKESFDYVREFKLKENET